VNNSLPIIVVVSCKAHRETRQRAIRETWLRRLPDGVHSYFVEGGHGEAAIIDGRIQLPVPDGYDDLAEKCFRAMELLSGELDFRGLVKCDDDTYLHAERCIGAMNTFENYNGKPTRGQDQFSRYAQGGCYWLSRAALQALVAEPFESYSSAPWYKGNTRMRKLGERSYRETASIEDVMVGSILSNAGFELTTDTRFHDQIRPTVYEDATLISNHYVSPQWMYRIDRMGNWPKTPYRRLLMRLWTSLPSASKPR
jgi:hypothetical protein